MRGLLLFSTALLAPFAAAIAQPPQGPEGARPDSAQFEERMAQHRAERAQDLATVLSLKPAQKPALDAWLASMTPPPHDGKRERYAEDTAPKTTDAMLQRKQQRLAERQQRETARIESTRRFYAALDSRQKAVFDALERLRHDGPHHGFGGGRHGMHGE